MLEEMAAELRDAHPDRRVDRAGRHHVHANLLLDQLDGSGTRELMEPAFRGDVRSKVGSGHRSKRGADVHDAAAAALAHGERPPSS